MASNLGGRTILITGAASGIGAATARRLAADGARLLLADVNGEGVGRLASELDQRAIQVDVTEPETVAHMINAAYQEWGRLDVVFNNAGIGQAKPLLEITEADWDQMLDVNLRAVFFVLQAAAKRMAHQEPIPGSELRGKLVQTASIAAFRGASPYLGHYAASKAGVVSITRTAAQALAPHKITSNCICPGVVDTPLWQKLDQDWGEIEGWEPGEAWRRRISGIPLGRPERVDDVAGLVSFLAGADSDYMTGQAVIIDGGLVMGN
ncbi:MAG: SDR family oxidoreductase [Chloroflexi bacterium]|nr:SDR family oxidoreductase [Chloroflexota bacterium]